jgi:two-component system phosphate regulon sensor histidine kinase PhoR
MRNPLKKIIIAFILIALIPVGFIVYELSSLNKNEAIVKETYQNQLEAILFSVNQYSDDIISSWANRIRMELSSVTGNLEKDTASNAKLVSLVNELSALQYAYFSDLKGTSYVFGRKETSGKAELRATIDKLIALNTDRIHKLITYQKAGFRKMEAIDTILSGDLVPITFIIDKPSGNFGVGVMLVDVKKFIHDILGPKMQEVSQEKLIISAFRREADSLAYSTESITPGGEPESEDLMRDLRNNSQKKQLWLLPGYYLGISLKGATINDLVKDRVNKSLVILTFLIVLLSAGIIFLYRNIRREIYLSQAKSEFVSNVSHEIRTPLSLISMYAETLEMNRVSEEKKKEYYSIISKETLRLSRIVNRILNFSQLEANRKTYEIKSLHLNELVSQVLDSYFFHLKDKGFTCVFVKGESLPPIRGDRESIAEAVINLIDNAIKYSHEKKEITITTGAERRFAFIEVKDEGIGIPRNYQSEIFEKFYRAPTGDVHNTKGSGLGLTLVKKTMEAHQGKIKLESAPGKGSAFRLYFPVKLEKQS